MVGPRARYALWKTRRWVTARDIAPADPLPAVRLHAVVSTWNEADIIGTTVQNCLEQGCEAVHLLDNDSTDGTVEVAVAAGAVVAEVFATPKFDLRDINLRMNGLVERVSRSSGDEHVWWLYLDADELIEGPDGTTVRSLVDGLDRSHRVVGSRTFNHYPRRDHPFVAGEDPRHTPTNVQERIGSACALGHWKHPLVRWDAAGPELRASHGFHVVSTDRRLVEPTQALVTNHYQYRSQAVTTGRLEQARPRLKGYGWALENRESNLDVVYREAYDEVDPFDMVGPFQRFAPVPAPPVRPR